MSNLTIKLGENVALTGYNKIIGAADSTVPAKIMSKKYLDEALVIPEGPGLEERFKNAGFKVKSAK